MKVSKRPRTNERLVSIPELYAQCVTAENNLATPQDLDKFKLILAKVYFFDQNLFLPPPVLASAQHTHADFKLSRRIWESGKYRRIIEVLKRQTKREDRLFLVALWLRAEQVCEPEEILGTEALRRLAKKHFRCISPVDFYHASRVEKWVPYFERLRTDFRICNGVKSKLKKLGYDEGAICAATKKRSAIPAACEWLTTRRNAVSNVGASSLRNAHSRHYGSEFRAAVESGRFFEGLKKPTTQTVTKFCVKD